MPRGGRGLNFELHEGRGGGKLKSSGGLKRRQKIAKIVQNTHFFGKCAKIKNKCHFEEKLRIFNQKSAQNYWFWGHFSLIFANFLSI